MSTQAQLWSNVSEIIQHHINVAEGHGREIDDATARMIAVHHHDGSTTTLAFTSTGIITVGPSELWRDFFPDFRRLSREEQREANWLGTYLIHAFKARGHKPVPGWQNLWHNS